MNPLAEHEVEEYIGNLLRIGMLVAATFVGLGGILYLLHAGAGQASYQTFLGEPAHLTEIPKIVQGALHGDGQSVIVFGLLLLIATPVARVALCVYFFARQRDYLYVVLTTVVLGLLTVSLLG